jgi:hypothetical protein
MDGEFLRRRAKASIGMTLANQDRARVSDALSNTSLPEAGDYSADVTLNFSLH